MVEACKSDCKFCIIHEYGVFVLNISGLIILLLVIKIYWREIVSFCTGNSKPIFPTDMSLRDQSQTLSPIITNFPQNSPIYTQSPVIVAQPLTPFLAATPKTSDQLRPLPPGFNRRSSNKKTKRPRTPAVHASDRSTKKTVPETQSPASPDPFKLPTPDPRDIIADNESTGSNYYKQMMKGRKPVLSISQYLDKNKHKKVTNEPKKHHTKKDKK